MPCVPHSLPFGDGGVLSSTLLVRETDHSPSSFRRILSISSETVWRSLANLYLLHVLILAVSQASPHQHLAVSHTHLFKDRFSALVTTDFSCVTTFSTPKSQQSFLLSKLTTVLLFSPLLASSTFFYFTSLNLKNQSFTCQSHC